MRLKVGLRRSDGSSDDILVEADASTTIAEVARALVRVDRRHVANVSRPTLAAWSPGEDRMTVLSSRALLGEGWIGSGADIQVVEEPVGHDQDSSPVMRAMVQVETLARGSSVGLVISEHPLSQGSYVVGRGDECDIMIDDPHISPHHLRIDVSAQSTEVVDIGSAGGTEVDGVPVQRFRLDGRTRLLMGDTWLDILPLEVADHADEEPGPVPFVRPPRVEARYAGEEFEAPEAPQETEPQNFPFLALLAPVLMGFGMYALTHRLMSLMFVALTPLMLVGNFLTQKTRARRLRQRDIARFDERLGSLRTALAAQVDQEREVRLAEAPSTGQIYAAAMGRDTLLWTRRPEHWSFLNIRLGTGTMPSRDTIKVDKERGALLPDFQERLDAVVVGHESITDVPIVENLFDAGALGFAGSPAAVGGAVDSALIQLTGLHSPSEVIVTAMVGPAWIDALRWLTWIPHTSSPTSPIEGHHLSTSASTAGRLLAQLEGVVSDRQKALRAQRRGAMKRDDAAMERGSDVGDGGAADAVKAPLPVVVAVVSEDIDIDRARLVHLAEQGPDAGVFLVWLAQDVSGLPAVCRTFVVIDAEDSYVGLVRLGLTISDAKLELVGPGAAMVYARRLAPVYDVGALVEDAGDIPSTVPMPSLLGKELFTRPSALVERWSQNQSIIDRQHVTARRRASGLRALVGSTGVDPMVLDLRGQGPHALVGGTTGSGKSEFLQAWVLAMAAEYSPDRVTFLFVDYKGGAAFADCVRLPHCVGLVTDLSPHLVVRALTSLRAELHYREHLFQRKKVKDILDLEKRGDPECPPALVLVIDEFAALVGDVPEFVDGVVDVAQRGRSLGIHLVMATQRPAGVIKDNLRANTNLRVALRMADEADSRDVVDVKDAAHFDPSTPGRGLAKTGPGRLMAFQSAYAGGWTSDVPQPHRVDVYRLGLAGLDKWEEPDASTDQSVTDRDLGPNDQQRFVDCAIAASTLALLPSPRRPWVEALGAVCPLPFGEFHFDAAGHEHAAPGQPVVVAQSAASGDHLLAGSQATDAELLLGLADLPAEQAQRPLHFRPDQDGHMAIFGTSGSGKSVALRTIAACAGMTVAGGPVHVYGLDFAAGGLRMVEGLPHVAGIVKGEQTEKVITVFRLLQAELARRREAFAAVSAASVVEYRRIIGQPAFPRILLLIDGYPSFKEDYENVTGRTEWYEVFRDILNEGRSLGIHIVLTADRAGAVPTYVRSLVQRNLLLRMSEESYIAFNAPRDVVTASSPPGRGLLDGIELQIGVLGGTPDAAEQAKATVELGQFLSRLGVEPAPRIRVLPTSYPPTALPDSISGLPVLGLDSIRLEPYGFAPQGVMMVAGPASSGRSNALAVIARAMIHAQPMSRRYLVSSRPSSLVPVIDWAQSATSFAQAHELATWLLAEVKADSTDPGLVIVVESYADLIGTPTEKVMVDLVKATRTSAHLFVAEAETSNWSGLLSPMMTEIKSVRRGLLLRPENGDGDALLRTSLPRTGQGQYPAGRGVYVARGQCVQVQLPLLDGSEDELGAWLDRGTTTRHNRR